MDTISRKFTIGSIFLGLSRYFGSEWYNQLEKRKGILIQFNNSGIFAEWIGGRALVGYTLILSSIFTAAGPIAATSENFWLLFATRFIVGVFGVKLIIYVR